MEEFYFEDKNKNISIRGMAPHNDVNCPPFDYFRLWHVQTTTSVFSDILKVKCPIAIPESIIRKFMLEETDKMIAEQFGKTTANPQLHTLLTDNTLSYKDQNKLLKDLTLTASDLLWLNKEAQEFGYLLDVYHEEKYPTKFDEKKHPLVFNQKADGSIETIGETTMTEGEMRAMLQQRKVVQARVYHKGQTWHCFYFTFKGLAGEESGVMGSQPHYHYLSDKSGITWDDLVKRIKDCNMPTSKVHIIIDRS